MRVKPCGKRPRVDAMWVVPRTKRVVASTNEHNPPPGATAQTRLNNTPHRATAHTTLIRTRNLATSKKTTPGAACKSPLLCLTNPTPDSFCQYVRISGIPLIIY